MTASFALSESDIAPLVREVSPAPDVATAFRALAHRPHCLLLDSALRHRELGRYSFLMADPFDYWECSRGTADPLDDIEQRHARYHAKSVAGLPPFQGGAAGLLSYELGSSLERIPAPRYDEFQLPIAAIGWYDVVLAWDHAQQRAWLISHGWPEREAAARQQRACHRIEQFQHWLSKPGGRGSCRAGTGKSSGGSSAQQELRPPMLAMPGEHLPASELCPQYPMPQLPELTSNFSQADYLRAAQQAIDYIYAGDVFQVNLAQRLLYPDDGDSIGLYLRLRERNPATFAGYFAGDGFQIASASPERFLKLNEGRIETRPIKGTRHRNRLPEADLFTGDELQASEKDRAENVMIVDLLRNDLSRVCIADSIRVRDLCRLEVYETVQHLVSVVEGRLEAAATGIDALRCSFPGGSITGAPKVRAMEIISELEPTARGAYCGSMGYIGFDGAMDWNILIRTITVAGGWRQLPVGGGIVAQSDPHAEYKETWHKAEGMLRALT